MKVGDKVKLNSGGPTMTIDSVTEYVTHTKVVCVWVTESGVPQTAYFDLRCVRALRVNET